MHVGAYETDDGSPIYLGEVQAAYSSASLHRGFPATVCRSGRTYVQERLQVLASEFGPNRLGGCSALQDGLHCTAGRVALHCGEGCSALRGKPLFFSQPHGLCHEQRDEGFLARARLRIYIMYNSSSSDGKSFRKRP